MATSGFHVSVNGPAGQTFPSFQVSELVSDGDISKIILKSIRRKCAISNKLFFTTDGKSPISDNLTLAYYMSLTPDGTKIQAGQNGGPKSKSEPSEGTDDKGEGEGSEAPEPAVATFTINVAGTDASPAPSVPLSVKNEALAKLMEGVGQGTMELGKLPGFENRDLVSLRTDYATLPSETQYKHPSEMKESDWAKVLANTRALYGYSYDYSTSIGLRKARKQAFKIQGRASIYDEFTESGAQDEDEAGDSDNKVILPPLPPFYVEDDASVQVNESRSQYQSTLIKQGFNSRAIEFSLSGEYKGIGGSVEASNKQESEKASQQTNASDVQSLVCTYNFPRVVIELDQDSLDLTDECKRDAMNVTSKEDVAKFYRNYGTVFATSFALGGCLHSTRLVTQSETASLDQIKNSTRTAAGISILSPFASASVNHVQSQSDSTTTGSASLRQDVQLAWDARGGNTLLCSNPPAWASTVNDFNLWRLLDQQRMVKLEGLLRDIDNAAAFQLDNPSPLNQFNDDPTDPEVDGRARIILSEARLQAETSVLWQKVKDYYIAKRFDTEQGSATYNTLIKARYPTEAELLIQPKYLFAGLKMDQQIGVGLYMFNKGDLKL